MVVPPTGARSMSLAKLARQLKRDLVKNPKKAVILVLLLLVAAYFWAPLIGNGLFAGSSGSSAKTAENPPAQAPPSTGTADAPAPKAEPKFRWDQLVAWMEQDRRMTSAKPTDVPRNPFHRSQPELTLSEQVFGALRWLAVAVQEQEQVTRAEPEMTPEVLGLVLGSTLISPRSRTARIDGTSYSENSTVVAKKDDSVYEFQVCKIEPDGVVLRRHGKDYRLELARAKLAKGDRIVLRGRPITGDRELKMEN